MILHLKDYFRLQPKPLLGIDLGSSAFKILALSRGPKDEYVVEGSVMQRGAIHLNALNACPKQFKEVAMGLPSAAAFSCLIQMNKALTMEEIAEQIQIEAPHLIPYPLEEVYYDFEVIGQNRMHAELLDILFVASKIETVNARIASIQDLGFNVRIVDLESLAMERAFAWIALQLPAKGVHQRVVLLDIGAQCITSYVFYHFKLQHSQEHELSIQASVVSALKQILEQLCTAQESQSVQAIVLAGGGILGYTEGFEIVNDLETTLGIKTVMANPFLNMQVSSGLCAETLHKEAPAFMLSLGLALRNFDNDSN